MLAGFTSAWCSPADARMLRRPRSTRRATARRAPAEGSSRGPAPASACRRAASCACEASVFQFWSVLDWQTHTSWFRGTCCAVRQAFGHGGGQQSAPRHTTASSARNPAAAHGEAESARHRQVISGAAADAVTDAGIRPQHREAALQRLHGLHRRRFAPYVVLPLPRLAGHLLDHDVRPPAVLLLVPGPVQRRPGSARARMRCSYPASREASLLTCLQQRLVPWRHAWPRRAMPKKSYTRR